MTYASGVADGEAQDRRHPGIDEAVLELRAEVGEGVGVVAEVPVELGLDEAARQRRQRRAQQREQRAR